MLFIDLNVYNIISGIKGKKKFEKTKKTQIISLLN